MTKLRVVVLRCSWMILLLSGCTAWAQTEQHLPIIDMHLHAFKVADFGVGLGAAPATCLTTNEKFWNGWDTQKPLKIGELGFCAGPRSPSPGTDDELMRETLVHLRRYNMRAVTSGDSGDMDVVMKWHASEPSRIIPAIEFQMPGHDAQGRPLFRPVAELRELIKKNKIAVFAEVAPQYEGMSPADPQLEPYFALAEELDIPVGVHMGEGPPGGPNVEGYSKYRVKMGDPLLLEDVLIRHPKLRIYVMHFGSPFVDNMIALLFSYPQVYVDIAGNDWTSPRKQFHSQLRRLVEAGYGKRILFGSDQMIWPQTIEPAIESVESADFLTAEQKRDIFYNNAVRFLRLETRDHSPK
jgi:uncharacterized protein